MKRFIIFFILCSIFTIFSMGSSVLAQGKNPHDVVLVQCGSVGGVIVSITVSTSANSPVGLCAPFATPCAQCLADYQDTGFRITQTTTFTGFTDALHTLER